MDDNDRIKIIRFLQWNDREEYAPYASVFQSNDDYGKGVLRHNWKIR